MRKVVEMVLREFVVGRMSMSEFHSRQPSIRIGHNETPALLVADQEKLQFSLRRNFTLSEPFANQIQRNETDAIVSWDDLFREKMQWHRLWFAVTGSVTVLLLAVFMLTSRIKGMLETRLSHGGQYHNVDDALRNDRDSE
jgi:hypothetical protein